MMKNKDLLANISQLTGFVSIVTDVLVIMNMPQFDVVSLALEIGAIGTGIAALVSGQDKKKATSGIILGAIGIAVRLFFGGF